MFLLKGIPIGILLFLVPFLLGNLICYKDSSGIINTLAPQFMIGFFASLSIFWVLCVPMSFFKISFTALVTVYSIVLIVLCGFSIWICGPKRLGQQLASQWRTVQWKQFETIYLILFLVLLCIQIYFALFYDVTVWSYDDYDYIARSNDTIATDHMFLKDVITGEETGFFYNRVLNSWDIYIAYLSRISGFHVTTVAHTIIPAAFLLIAYLVDSYLAAQLFHKRENRRIFLCILSVAFIFGLYSPYALTFRMLVTLWQGKAILSVIVVPFLIGFLPKAYIQEKQKRIYLYLVVISMAACSLTMMGSGMSVAVYIVMLAVIILYRRRLAGIGYCICGCTVPALQILFYLVMR